MKTKPSKGVNADAHDEFRIVRAFTAEHNADRFTRYMERAQKRWLHEVPGQRKFWMKQRRKQRAAA